MKQEVVDATLNKEGAKEPRKRITISETRLPMATLTSFTTKASLHLLDALGIQRDFLSTNPRRWHEDESYVEACYHIEGLRIANDTAESGVALKDIQPLTHERRGTEAIPPPACGAIPPKAARDSQVQPSRSKLATMSALATHENPPSPPEGLILVFENEGDQQPSR